MGMATFDATQFISQYRHLTGNYLDRFEENLEVAILEVLQEASRNNYRNRTGRLWRSQKILPGHSVRIGNSRAHYWRYIDNFTRGRGEFVRRLIEPQEVRDRIIERAVQLTEQEFG